MYCTLIFYFTAKKVPPHLRNVKSKLSKTFHENERYFVESMKGWTQLYSLICEAFHADRETDSGLDESGNSDAGSQIKPM